MFLKCSKYATAIVLTASLSLLLFGCGGGSGAATQDPTAPPGPAATPDPSATPDPTPAPTDGNGGGFTVTGKISLADSTLIKGATVSLYKTSYTIYTFSKANGDPLYTTMNSNGIDSVSLASAPQSTTSTGENGVYSFTGVQGGSYTIVPTSATYVFKWSQVPTRNNIGVITVTGSGTVYIYNPEGLGNTIVGTIIYNTGTPFTITGNVLDGQDFIASVPGGGGVIPCVPTSANNYCK